MVFTENFVSEYAELRVDTNINALRDIYSLLIIIFVVNKF
jgi:hypothetical protein